MSIKTWAYDTERYRYATLGDLDAITEMLADPEVGRWLWFTPADSEAIAVFFSPFIDQQSKQLETGETPRTAVFVVEGPDSEFLGQGAVVAVDGSPGGFEIGFQLCRKSWGRGVGRRLSRFLCAYAMVICDAYRIEGSCLEGNVGSRALLSGLGLDLEGTRPGFRLKEGVRHTELLYGAMVADLDGVGFRRVAHEVGLLVRG